MEPIEYTPDPLLDEEVDEALAKNDPAAIWRLTTLLGTMDLEEYAIHRAAIKTRFSGRIPMADLDKAVAAKRNARGPSGVADEDKIPPNEIGNSITAKYDLLNVRDNIYTYDGKKWISASLSYLRQLALREDGEGNTTKNRRSEITDYIADNLYTREQQWRQIEIYEVPVSNGVVDVRTMKVRPHRLKDYIQTCVPWEFHTASKCPALMECLDTYFGDDDDCDAKVNALQEFFGYCLMPHARYKKALLCVGESDCGKSTIPFLLRQLLGHENVAAVGVEHMDDDRKRAPLLGKLVNLLTELTSDAMIADGGFKTLVSTEEPIQFDPKFEKPVMDVPICKHVIVTNVKPRINDKSNGTYRRLLLIHFNHVIPKEDQNTKVWDRLKAEIPGILSWALEGAARLYDAGGAFTDPGAAEVIEYRSEQNPLQGFIEDCCEIDGAYKTRCTSLVERFRGYHGGRWSPQQVVGLLKAAGYEVTPNAINMDGVRTRCVMGLRLVS